MEKSIEKGKRLLPRQNIMLSTTNKVDSLLASLLAKKEGSCRVWSPGDFMLIEVVAECCP